MASRKKIIYIGGFDLPDNNAAAQRVLANSKLFKDLGFDVFLIGLTKNPEMVDKHIDYQGFVCVNLSYPAKVSSWFSYLLFIRKYKQYLIDENPEVIIAYNFPAISLYNLHQYGIKNNIKVIADCTEWYQPQGSFFFKLIKGADVNLRMKYVQSKLDGIIVISTFLYNYYKKKYCKILLLPPLVDTNDDKWKKMKLNIEESDQIKLIYAGSPGSGNKDRLDIIINSIMKIRRELNINISMDIIGLNKEKYDTIYKTNLITPSYIHFLGRLQHLEVVKRLHCSDFQIFIRECNLANIAGFPTKFVESVTSGVLVLTNYSSDLEQFLKEGINGFPLDISSEKALIESLSKVLLFSKEQISALKEKGDSTIFDYRKFIPQTKCFIESLFENN